MVESLKEIEKSAKSWLKKQISKERFVFKRSEIGHIFRYLEKKQLLGRLNSQYVFIKSDSEPVNNAFRNNLWTIVFQFLNIAYADGWYLTGYYAYQFTVDNFSSPEKQIAIVTRKKSNSMIELPDSFKIVASYDKDFDKKLLVTKEFFTTKYFQTKPEYLTINSTESDYRTYQNEIISILKSNERDENYILDYFTNNSQPVLLARLIGALREIEDFSLRIELENILKISGAKVSIKNPFGPLILNQSLEKPPYLNRFELSMQKAIEYLAKLNKPRRLAKPLNIKDLEKIVVDDTYHSLTIEGYTVTKALIQYLKDDKDTKEFPDDLRNKLAAKGFMNALDYIRSLSKTKYIINEQVSRKLFQELWKPSFNAGLIEIDLDIYRKHMVGIKGSQYVPPSHEKLPYLIDELFDYARTIENGFELGIFLHFFYVSVHPHSDGNGRIARFLMNLAFIKDRYSWLTIPSDDRKKYFSALQRSQMEDDISFFAEYIVEKYL